MNEFEKETEKLFANLTRHEKHEAAKDICRLMNILTDASKILGSNAIDKESILIALKAWNLLLEKIGEE